MFKIRPYNAQDDFKMIETWYQSYNPHSHIHPGVLPASGLIVLDSSSNPVAVQTYINAENKFLFLDCFIMNPEFKTKTKLVFSELMTTITTELRKKTGIAMIYAYTEFPSIVESAKLAGYTAKPGYTLLFNEGDSLCQFQ